MKDEKAKSVAVVIKNNLRITGGGKKFLFSSSAENNKKKVSANLILLLLDFQKVCSKSKLLRSEVSLDKRQLVEDLILKQNELLSLFKDLMD